MAKKISGKAPPASTRSVEEVVNELVAAKEQKGYISKADSLRARNKEPSEGPKSKKTTSEGPIIIPEARLYEVCVMVRNLGGQDTEIYPSQKEVSDLLQGIMAGAMAAPPGMMGVGSSLLTHAWSHGVIAEMLEDHMLGESDDAKKKRKAKNRKRRNPWGEFLGGLYHHPMGGFAFPTIGFKLAMIEAIRFVEGVSMETAKRAFTILGDLAQIRGLPKVHLVPVEVGATRGKGSGVADLRFRPQFTEWCTTLSVRADKNAMPEKTIVDLLTRAGISCGIGDWRGEKAGNHGLFEIVPPDEMEAVEASLPLGSIRDLTFDNTGMTDLLVHYELLDQAIDAIEANVRLAQERRAKETAAVARLRALGW